VVRHPAGPFSFELGQTRRVSNREAKRTIFGAPCEGTVSQRVRIPPGKVAPAGSNRSSRGGNEAAEASGVEGHISDLASMQAVT